MVKKSILITFIIISISLNLFSQYPVTKDNKSPFVEVVKRIRESVVNVRVEYEVEYSQGSGNFPFDDDFFRFFFPDIPRTPQPKSRKSLSMGSGFIFKQDGRELFIITNN
ncbi:MAG: hypothetical protein KAT74_09190, partial [Candidatus Cloacimonetes bacterium]|nr:hypothetical protein [Candidatus Cloacimonadota bacterium]